MWKSSQRSEMVSGLRTRYVPRSRLGQGLISMAPWVDLVLLIVFFVLIKGTFVIEPGVQIELPTAPLRGGAPAGLAAVVLSVETGQPGLREEMVVFDDVRYLVQDEAQMARLQTAIAREAIRLSVNSLLLDADRRVENGTLVRLYAMAREIGLAEVNLATKSPAAPGGN